MKSGFVLPLVALVTLCGIAEQAVAQATRYNFRDPASEADGTGHTLPAPAGPNGNYYNDDNWWAPNTFARFIPDYSVGNGEQSFIENGGTAIVNSNNGISTGQLVLGSAGGTSGTLEVQSGGVLASKIGVSTNGNITVGSSGGTGTLRVLPGGTLTADSSIVEGSNTNNSIQVGNIGGVGTATLTGASATLASKVQVFPNAAFSTTGAGNFLTSATYTSEITGNGANGKFSVGATASLNGNLVLHFNSPYTPSVGHNWNVLEAAAYSGSFSSVTTNATLASNQNFVVTRPSLGGGKTGYNVSLQEVLVLEVNRDTGMVTLKHPGSAAIPTDGYFIGSDAGSLVAGNWNKFQNAAGQPYGNDWVATAATTHNLGELKVAGDASLAGGNTLNFNFGNVYDPYAGDFGTVNEDLQFVYRRSSDGAQFPGRVQYTGTKFNTLLLQVDPTGSGHAFLRNTSPDMVEIDSYDVLSAAGRLDTSWTGIDGAATAWVPVNSNANQIGEVNQSGFTTVAPGASIDLGKLYLGGTQDLAFSFLLRGKDTATVGKVIYSAFAGGVPGDYNGNGKVDAADYTIWRDTLGSTTDLRANGDNTGASLNKIDAADYAYWKARFGNTSGSGSGSLSGSQVPEPAAWIMIASTLGLCFAKRRQQR